jgi:pSer/pThr/pTyr-binding forkhead associated (FHA) protein
MQGKVLPITLTQFLIGRDAQCHLRPASPVISNRHCALLVRGGRVLVRDFESTNGTFINDEPVRAQRELHDQDILRVGPVAFRVQIEATPAAASVTASPAAAPTASPADALDDEAMAALLLAVPDDPDSQPGTVPVDSEGIPTGSTVMDMPVPAAAAAEPEPATKNHVSKQPASPPMAENTSAVANTLLQKYLRRPRK